MQPNLKVQFCLFCLLWQKKFGSITSAFHLLYTFDKNILDTYLIGQNKGLKYNKNIQLIAKERKGAKQKHDLIIGSIVSNLSNWTVERILGLGSYPLGLY